MAAGFIHTVYKFGRWTNVIEGDESHGDSDIGIFDTKDAAVAAGRKEAMQRKTEHVIHSMDGTIAERNSYGNDPASRPG